MVTIQTGVKGGVEVPEGFFLEAVKELDFLESFQILNLKGVHFLVQI